MSRRYFVNLLNLDCTVGSCRLPYAIVKYDIDEDIAIRDEKRFMQKIEVGQTGLLLGEISESNPFSVNDALYVLLPGQADYRPLTKEIYKNISTDILGLREKL